MVARYRQRFKQPVPSVSRRGGVRGERALVEQYIRGTASRLKGEGFARRAAQVFAQWLKRG